MTTVLLEAQVRTDMGKGASRRLRRLENKVPGIIYGGNSDPIAIHVLQNKLVKALETESIYSSVFDIKVDGKVEHVILKALQRHPYKPTLMHLDLQRVSAQDVLVKLVPLHFIHEEEAKGVKAGGMISHTMTQIEIRCKAKNLPEFIEVDMLNVGLNEAIHLSQIKLPKDVSLAVELKDETHDAPVVSIHSHKGALEDIEDTAVAADAVPAIEEKDIQED
ncbi:MAG: 50S ribosomal protein L25/general stress protein Ctc [Legionella sp.]|nr:50S ribosomal protein L25/general stress protein Ctc [Legionella sp.]